MAPNINIMIGVVNTISSLAKVKTRSNELRPKTMKKITIHISSICRVALLKALCMDLFYQMMLSFYSTLISYYINVKFHY